MVDSVIQLRCQCNNYPWGKQGSDSLAATLCEKTPNTGFKIDNSEFYAEMWMGTYPVLPSYVLATGEDLQDVLNANQDLIGKGVIQKFGDTKIPYLPKVLSIAKALPLQVHPNKELSAKLHAQNPDQFTDPNHKPEIAVALSTFEAFCGWKPLAEIQSLFELKPLQKYAGTGNQHFNDETLKKIVHTILQESDGEIKKTQSQLMEEPKAVFGNHEYIKDLLPRLQDQYGATDPGNLVALLCMNYMVLQPGESIYIPADGIHAYLSGDIIECMARSNNVLNTGFCPRADRDSIDLFMSTLSFAPHSAKDAVLPSQSFARSKNGKTVVFAPPMSEFNMLFTTLAVGEADTVAAINGPSILIVTNGRGKLEASSKSYDLEEGYVFFIGQGTETKFSANSDMKIWRAYAE